MTRMLTNRQVQVLRYLKNREVPPTAREVAVDIGLSPSTAHAVLNGLAKLEMVEKHGVALDGGRTWKRLR